MATSLLQQAVSLAQQGQRDEAARLLRQFVQSNPNHEVAWLWLASVAGDQPEYVRALNEVLRINPANARARRLLDDFNQQYGPVSAAPGGAPQSDRATPVLPVDAVSAPRGTPSAAPPSPPPSPMPVPGAPVRPSRDPSAASAYEPYEDEWAGPPSGAPGSPVSQPPSQVRYITDRQVIVKRRGCFPGCMPACMLPGCGCGCWQGCLLALVLILVLPIVACVALSATPNSLGPLDWPASYLPDRLGRKTIEMTHEGYAVKLTVPRSWQIAVDQNEWWEAGREVLTESVPFAGTGTSWTDFEAEVGRAVEVLETDPIAIARAGDRIGMRYMGIEQGSYACDSVRTRAADFDDYVPSARSLCGWYTHTLTPWQGVALRDLDPPDQTRTIEFRVPIDESAAMRWQVFLPEKAYNRYRRDISALIESVEITRIAPEG